MRGWIWTASLFVLAGGCAPFGSPVPPGRPVRAVYEEIDGGGGSVLRVEASGAPGAPEKVRPVIYPPKVFAVYVPEHLDRERDFKIGAHWVYIKLRDSSWTEEAIDREPPGGDEIAASEKEQLKSALSGKSWGALLVPAEAPAPAPPQRDR